MKNIEAIRKLDTFTIERFEAMTPECNSISGYIATAKLKNTGNMLINLINKDAVELLVKSHQRFHHPKDVMVSADAIPKIFDTFNSKPITIFPLIVNGRVAEILIKDAYTSVLPKNEYEILSKLTGFNNITKFVREKKKNVLAIPYKKEIFALSIFNGNVMPFKETERIFKNEFIQSPPELFTITESSSYYTAIPTRHAMHAYDIKNDIHFMNFFDLNMKIEDLMEKYAISPLLLDTDTMMFFKPNPIYDLSIITEDDIYKAAKLTDSLFEGINFNDRYESVIMILQESFSEAMVGALLDQILSILKQQYMQNGGYTYLFKISGSYSKRGMGAEEAVKEFTAKHPKMNLLQDEFKEVYKDATEKELDVDA
jgi:hypothetical protein